MSRSFVRFEHVLTSIHPLNFFLATFPESQPIGNAIQGQPGRLPRLCSSRSVGRTRACRQGDRLAATDVWYLRRTVDAGFECRGSSVCGTDGGCASGLEGAGFELRRPCHLVVVEGLSELYLRTLYIYPRFHNPHFAGASSIRTHTTPRVWTSGTINSRVVEKSQLRPDLAYKADSTRSTDIHWTLDTRHPTNTPIHKYTLIST